MHDHSYYLGKLLHSPENHDLLSRANLSGAYLFETNPGIKDCRATDFKIGEEEEDGTAEDEGNQDVGFAQELLYV